MVMRNLPTRAFSDKGSTLYIVNPPSMVQPKQPIGEETNN